jgi:bifunctional N-acetylglucosamine-1-phosphate-uridyltransferase/glucosamine-1-phosphate-acetyltransferase GlmU-like protein
LKWRENSHLRPESDIGEEAHVGNFVETKKTRLDRGAKRTTSPISR